MQLSWRWGSVGLWSLATSLSGALAQTVMNSNSDSDIYPYDSSPRFILNGTHVPSINIAPLGPYAQGSTRGQFLNEVGPATKLLKIGPSVQNADAIETGYYVYMSCDASYYDAGNFSPTDVFNIVYSNPHISFLILFSEVKNHCNVSDLNNIPSINGVFTTVNSTAAANLANNYNLGPNSPLLFSIRDDPNSFTNASGGWDGAGTGLLGPSPTTAVAMIILYSITGIITALFVVIIITGAIRAHRHPERYGPRNIVGRTRQSRAKGIARAMLETIPIVKFGDHADLPVKQQDVEMNNTTTEANKPRDHTLTPVSAAPGATAAAITEEQDRSVSETSLPAATGARPDGTDAEGHLGCSICTEDFTKGEEVRVLPCNHKFHPECVDPWLLNVSGTCPLCRIDLRPQGDEGEEGADEPAQQVGGIQTDMPPPLNAGTGRRDTVTSLRNLTGGTREERIAALRRLRDERRRRGVAGSALTEGTADRRRLRDRLRERFRVRTTGGDERRGTNAGEEATQERFERLERLERASSRASQQMMR